LEQSLRLAAGESGYVGGFVEHYLLALIYPYGLTREIQFILAGVVITVNVAIYGWLVFHSLRPKRRSPPTPNSR